MFVTSDKLKQFDVYKLIRLIPSNSGFEKSLQLPVASKIYGTLPQGRADYVFWQHIIKSMLPKTGCCAILFQHGGLFYNEEQAMRKKPEHHNVKELLLHTVDKAIRKLTQSFLTDGRMRRIIVAYQVL